MTYQEVKKQHTVKTKTGVEENFPAIVILVLIIAIPFVLVAVLQGQVSSLSLKLTEANQLLQVENEKLKQLNYQLKELQSLQRVEEVALSLGLVNNTGTEIVVLVPPSARPASTERIDAGPATVAGAVPASLFDRLLDFFYGLLGGSELL